MGYEARNDPPYHAKKTSTVDPGAMTVERAMTFEKTVTVADERAMTIEGVGNVIFGRAVIDEMVVTDERALTVGMYRPPPCC